jgi:hypothetical protein
MMTNKKSPKPLLRNLKSSRTNSEARAPLSEFFRSKEFLAIEAKRKASFLARKGCDLLSSPNDFAAECSLFALEYPEKTESEIIAAVVQRALQSRSKSAMSTIFIDQDVAEGETKFEIVQPDATEIEEWRAASDDEIETLRQRICAKRGVTDRCARQIFQRTEKKVKQADIDDLFGRDSYRRAIQCGDVA